MYLMCKYGDHTAIMSVNTHTSYDELAYFVTGRWRSLRPDSFSLFYAIHCHLSCMLGNETDFRNMYSMACHFGLLYVNKKVYEHTSIDGSNNDLDTSFQLGNGVLECSKINDVETDLLLSFYSHQ